MTHTVASLRAFTARVAVAVNAGLPAGPVHLSDGNEQPMIDYFARHHRPGDWVFSTWRSHLHCLLAGVPEEEAFAAILAGRSISLCFPGHRFVASAIVAGHIPIAVGVAMGLKRKIDPLYEGSDPRLDYSLLGDEPPRRPHVHCFLGDMAARTGLFHECRRYAVGHDLPLTFVVEDNGLSVCTPTHEAWGSAARTTDVSGNARRVAVKGNKTVTYAYESRFPHSGASERTNF